MGKAISFVLVCLGLGMLVCVCIGFASAFYVPVQAAQPSPPTVTACEVVNTFGAIEIARCTPENGAPFYVNSLGFMLLGD